MTSGTSSRHRSASDEVIRLCTPKATDSKGSQAGEIRPRRQYCSLGVCLCLDGVNYWPPMPPDFQKTEQACGALQRLSTIPYFRLLCVRVFAAFRLKTSGLGVFLARPPQKGPFIISCVPVRCNARDLDTCQVQGGNRPTGGQQAIST